MGRWHFRVHEYGDSSPLNLLAEDLWIAYVNNVSAAITPPITA